MQNIQGETATGPDIDPEALLNLRMIYTKTVDELIFYRQSMLQIFVGSVTASIGLIAWFYLYPAVNYKIAVAFVTASFAIFTVGYRIMTILQEHANHDLGVLIGVEEAMKCWESGKYVAGRTLMPETWRTAPKQKWREAFLRLHVQVGSTLLIFSMLIVIGRLSGFIS
jgi:hypothetical protein